MTIQVALVGTGSMGMVHANAYREIGNAQVTAVVDVDVERARQIALIPGAQVYTSVDEMFAKETVNMVDICTPTFTHKNIAVQCAEHGVHILVEKPIAYTLEEARSMLESAHRNNVFFMVAQVLRFWPEYVYLKKVYDQGIFGRLIQVWFSRVCGAPTLDWGGWFTDPAHTSLAPFELHIHDLDFIFYLLGKPSVVSSVEVDQPEIRASYLKTNYQYKDLPGVVVEAEGGWWPGPIPFSASFRAVFEKAVLVYEREELTLYKTGTSAPEKCDFKDRAPGKSMNAFVNEIDTFVQCVHTNTPPSIITPDQSYAVLETLHAELISAQSGHSVIV